MAAATAATPKMTPTAMPALAPPERPCDDEDGDVPVDEEVGLGDELVGDGFPPNGQ